MVSKKPSFRNGVVSSAHPLASEAGVKVLKAGGNAVDAAVATSLALGVVAPAFSGVGGGGFLMVHLKDQETTYVDYRETAPRRATPGMFELESDGEVKGFANSMGYRSVGVPGTIAGLTYALEKFGTLEFDDVASHAIAYARKGFRVSEFLGTIMAGNVDNTAYKFRSFPESAREWLPGGRVPRTGETKTSQNYARVLEAVSKEGPDGFYRGEIASSMARDMEKNGGLVDEQDLKGYRVELRRPVKGTYRGLEVHAMPPPSLGGLVIVEALNILEDMDVGGMGLNSAEYIASVAKVLGAVWPELRRRVGDPSFVDVDVSKLSSKEFSARQWFKRGERGASAGGGQTGKNWTSHLSVIDKDQNVAAITESLECYFGSGVIVPGLGFFLNDTMHDFEVQGSSGPDSIAPGKRPTSNMTPTLLLRDGEPRLVAGSAGGPRIVTATLQTILNVVDHSLGVAEAVDAPRFHYQGSGPIRVESRIASRVRKGLAQKGFETETPNYVQLKPGYDVYFGGVHAVQVEPGGGLRGGADARRQGSAEGY